MQYLLRLYRFRVKEKHEMDFLGYTDVYCPHCKECADIKWQDGHHYWLKGRYWTCPHCGRESSTTELHNYERQRKAEVTTNEK